GWLFGDGGGVVLLHQLLEHPCLSDPPYGDLDRLIASLAEHHGLGRKVRTCAHQPFQLAARLQLIETPERGDHLLAHLVAVAAALNDLQIGAPGRSLAAEVHGGGSVSWCAHRTAIWSKKSNQITQERGTTHARDANPHQAKSMTYATSTRANCRRSVKMTCRRASNGSKTGV